MASSSSSARRFRGYVSQGRTVAEAEDNIRDAIRECLAARRELGLPLAIEVRDLDVPVEI